MTLAIRPKPTWKQFRHPLGGNWYRWGDVSVCVAGPEAEGAWHLSISHPTRYPTWDEIKAARYDLIPHDVTMAMYLPPPSEFVNIHDNCFHLHQVSGEDEERLIRERGAGTQ